ncbi:MAG: transporter [Candidatus Solibacter sp.]|nr:transporter [Candidatus Solibacter sp.]
MFDFLPECCSTSPESATWPLSSADDGDNTGLGLWGFEPSIGTTVYLDKTKTWSASTLASFEFNGDKRGTKTHVGDLLTLEGGLGRKFLKGAAKAGLVYYGQ